MIYLDHNARTPMLPCAVEALSRHAAAGGNPSSVHRLGQASRRILEASRDELAQALGGDGEHVVTTGSGSEAAALALIGLASRARTASRDSVVLTAVEHPAVYAAAGDLRRQGMRVRLAPVDSRGTVNIEALDVLLDEQVALVAAVLVSAAGVVQPMAQVVAGARRVGAWCFCDAAQAVGKIPVSLTRLGVDALAVSAHKFGGPPGVGALVMDKARRPVPLWRGGGQQDGRRPGTPPVALVAAMAAAVTSAERSHVAAMVRLGRARDDLAAALCQIPGFFAVGGGAPGGANTMVANTMVVGFDDVGSRDLVQAASAQGVMLGGGRRSDGRPSPLFLALTAMGLPGARAERAVRISLGRETTESELAAAARVIGDAVAALRGREGAAR